MHPWRDWLLRFVLTMSAAALVMAGGWFWLFHGTTPPGAAATYLLALPLVVNPAELDLGEVWEDSHFEWTFCAHNSTTRSVTIAEVRASCDCTRVAPQQFAVPAGQDQVISMTIDLTADEWEPGSETLPFVLTLEPRLGEGPIVPITWQLHGTLRRNPISVSRVFVDLDDRANVSDPRQGDSVQIELAEALVGATLQVECIPADVGEALLEPLDEGRYRLTTFPAVSLGPGGFEYRVLIRSFGEAEVAGPLRTICVSGTIAGDLRVKPGRVILGARAQGATMTEQIQISSAAGREIHVTVKNIEGAGTTVNRIEGTSAAEGVDVSSVNGNSKSKALFEVRQEYLDGGPGRGRVKFDVRYANGDEESVETLVVPITWHGLAAGGTIEKKADE